ncbi:glycerol-3-phosphate 1-O-acyltransferase PlsY [Spirulina major CS-329]|uniref:glycerol-3-phosphate 1-O-acyltransferase PlsY n=1 Tax=Spirulina TaxID=1154 RepID=UPI00232C7C0A|nr:MULTISPECIES: glycerol-3-phosphate 1-O-acyltransferase PlsY [Spirulina]MDB9495286.1 glycerol-3-phosphate 1-O-acyltransferase PlsY [Spirulina subsalsa CS-330]MDB9503440.1 glycerol-3-phosphate 1-O-acyltransferase PlsY [Spirulina major CS-329]
MTGLIIVGIAIASYLLGSFPTGYLVTKWLTGLDIRDQGSGSTGATNVLRTVGKWAAATVLLTDALKGAIALALVYSLAYIPAIAPYIPTAGLPWFATLAGLLALVGHSRSVWLQFKGGKSVATGIGILLVMSPVVALGTIAVFALTLAVSRIVSLGSILSAIAVTLLMLLLHEPLAYCLFGLLAGSYVIVRHRTNLQRIFNGTEPKIGQKLQPQPESTAS